MKIRSAQRRGPWPIQASPKSRVPSWLVVNRQDDPSPCVSREVLWCLPTRYLVGDVFNDRT